MARHHLRLVEATPPAPIVRAAEIPLGAIIWFCGRPLKVVQVFGTDPAAPVLLEELQAWGDGLVGQLSLWGADAVLRALAGLPAVPGLKR